MTHKTLLFKFLALFLSITYSFIVEATVVVTDLRTEHMLNPLSTGMVRPRLGWRIESTENDVRQTSYRIIVSSSAEKAERLEGDLWDTTQDGRQTQWIEYAGKPLRSGSTCYWRVCSTTNRGTTQWSNVAQLGVGLLTESDWSGQWIGMDHANEWDVINEHSQLSARYARSEFETDKEIKRATLYICGLGLYEAYINGQRVGDQVLAPAPTDYRRTALYNTYDVSQLLNQGNNAIGVVLGNGRYFTMQQAKKTYKITNFGYPKLRLNLVIEYADGSRKTISTNNKWKLTADGPIRSNNEYDGEIYDANKEFEGWTQTGFDDSTWTQAERVGGPYGTLRPQLMDGMKVIGTIGAQNVSNVNGKLIVDFGQNMAGRVRIRIPHKSAKDTIIIRYAELLDKDGNLYTENLRHAHSTDKYVASTAENGQSWWSPTFVYHGFRYVEITGADELTKADIVAEQISDQMETTGHFECGNDILNRVYANAVRGIEANYKGMPVDCPQRDERQPWLGDRTAGCSGESFIFDNHDLYVKWARDIVEAQREDGCIPDVAPAFWNYYSDIVTWPAALPFSLFMIGERFDDWKPLNNHYDAICHWLKHLKEKYQHDGLITKDKYGDWCVPPEDIKLIHSQDPARRTDGTLISSAYYYYICKQMASHAHSVADKDFFTNEAETTRTAFMKKFLTRKENTATVPNHLLYPDSTYYGNNTVTANLLGLLLTDDDYVREQAQKNILKNIITDNKDHISCGVIGISWLMRTLASMGRNDVAWLLATQKTYPSWGYMVEKGATTTWELWNGDTASPKMNSANHVMLLGDLVAWIYKDIVGIKQTTNGEIVLAPEFSVDEIDDINSSYKSIYGNIVSRWTKNRGKINWHIEIPANTTAEIVLPDGSKQKLSSGKHDIQAKVTTADKAIVCDEFVYRDASFPQCHSASIVETKKGDLVVTYFGGKHERNPDVCIWVNIKKKGSDHWSEPILAADGVFLLDTPDALLAGINDTTTEATVGPIKKRLKDKAFNQAPNNKLKRKACWNPVIYQDSKTGELVIYFKIGLKVADWTGWLVRSRDGGKTWSDREPLKEGFLGPIKNKIVSNKGRLIAPTSIETNGWKLYFELSDDGGKTWRKTDFVDADEGVRAIQPTVLILPDGRLEALCRTRSRQIGVTFSSDNGETWSKLQMIDTPNNNSGLDAVNLSDGTYALICNDWPIEKDKTKGARTPISLMRSSDGINWQHWLTLEDSPISQYSYPSIIQSSDGHIHVVYTWRRLRVKHEEIIP